MKKSDYLSKKKDSKIREASVSLEKEPRALTKTLVSVSKTRSEKALATVRPTQIIKADNPYDDPVEFSETV